ncbi:MAG: hypothetical protein M1816_001869, partial [Peltula sp. TS41687]
MPYIPHTPESLVGRSDSKDQATTCRGITSSGRPCRRGIGKSPRAAAPPSPTPGADVLRVDATTLFCWQHKDQVKRCEPQETASRQQEQKILAQRSSIDTLVDRLGIVRVGSPDRSRKSAHGDPLNLGNPNSVHGPSFSGEQSRRKSGRHRAVPPTSISPWPQRKRKERRGLLALLCCVSSEYEEDQDLTAPRVRPSKSTRQERPITKEHSSAWSNSRPVSRSHSESRRDISKTRKDKHQAHHGPDLTEKSKIVIPTGRTSKPAVSRPPLPQPPVSQTEILLGMIPKSLSPQTASLLLSELAKPLSNTDGAGYIYIFCLTDQTRDNSSAAASTILDTSDQRANQVLHDLSVNDSSRGRESRLLLKIGRATNVYRRMNQWMRQCGYDLSLVRWYPHVPSSSGPGMTPQKI